MIKDYIKELIGGAMASIGLVSPVVTGDWSFYFGLLVGAGLVLICWNLIDFANPVIDELE